MNSLALAGTHDKRDRAIERKQRPQHEETYVSSKFHFFDIDRKNIRPDEHHSGVTDTIPRDELIRLLENELESIDVNHVVSGGAASNILFSHKGFRVNFKDGRHIYIDFNPDPEAIATQLMGLPCHRPTYVYLRTEEEGLDYWSKFGSVSVPIPLKNLSDLEKRKFSSKVVEILNKGTLEDYKLFQNNCGVMAMNLMKDSVKDERSPTTDSSKFPRHMIHEYVAMGLTDLDTVVKAYEDKGFRADKVLWSWKDLRKHVRQKD